METGTEGAAASAGGLIDFDGFRKPCVPPVLNPAPGDKACGSIGSPAWTLGMARRMNARAVKRGFFTRARGSIMTADE